MDAEMITPGSTDVPIDESSALRQWPPSSQKSRDLQRTFRLLLATVWLMDAALQLQPFMFTRGAQGFSGMLNGTAPGNPSWISHSITWNASNVFHEPILWNTLFAGTQFVIAFGIAWKRTTKPALALSIVWSIGVWWFGEGLGNVFHGGATPFGGGPGAVLFYAVLAVLLWPSEGSNSPFVAARTIGERRAKALWVVIWLLLALLSLVGQGRSPQALQGLVTTADSGQPGWLHHLDRWSAAVLLHHGTEIAVLMAILCVLVAFSVYMPDVLKEFLMILALVAFACIWVAVEDVGGILAGGATDPNSGPLVILLILIYWPVAPTAAKANGISGARTRVSLSTGA